MRSFLLNENETKQLSELDAYLNKKRAGELSVALDCVKYKFFVNFCL